MIAEKIAISSKPLSKSEQQKGLIYKKHRRPRTREECALVPRPCPFVGCRYNLYLDQAESGRLYINRPGVSPLNVRHSCALDLADEGPQTLERISSILNLTMERVRQIEIDTINKVRIQHPEEVEGVPIPPAKPLTKASPLTVTRVLLHPGCKEAIIACINDEMTFPEMYNTIVQLLQHPVSLTMLRKFINQKMLDRQAREEKDNQ